MSSKKSSTSSSSRPRVLVTGCYGALGAYLSHRLAALGWHVDGIDLPTAQRRALPPGMRVMHRDIAAAADLAAAVRRYDGVLHLAGYSRVGQALAEPLAAIRANILGTAVLLEAIRLAPRRPWMLFASSGEVKTDGSGAYGLTNLYGLTKAVSELLSHRYAADYGLVVAAARIEGIYGIIDDYPNKVPLVFARQALAGETLRVNSSAKALDYIHVDDVCRVLIYAMRQLMKTPAPAFRSFYVRTGRAVSLPKIARVIRRAAGTKVPILPIETKSTPDIAMRLLKIPSARIKLEEGLEGLVKALRDGASDDVYAPPAAKPDSGRISPKGRKRPARASTRGQTRARSSRRKRRNKP
ncbi:MAG TPA: NAD-dependent epimerase/dehydratase family protein [Xanthobacteraceae bacterium]|nr:NAD-dependent epimerase/dehydratase family protein [Xanthobacteraceae bacterium]